MLAREGVPKRRVPAERPMLEVWRVDRWGQLRRFLMQRDTMFGVPVWIWAVVLVVLFGGFIPTIGLRGGL